MSADDGEEARCQNIRWTDIAPSILGAMWVLLSPVGATLVRRGVGGPRFLNFWLYIWFSDRRKDTKETDRHVEKPFSAKVEDSVSLTVHPLSSNRLDPILAANILGIRMNIKVETGGMEDIHVDNFCQTPLACRPDRSENRLQQIGPCTGL
jgi:hypothetical protein